MKRYVALALAALLCGSLLTACQPSNPTTHSGTDTATTTTVATTTTTTTTTTETTTTTAVPAVNRELLAEIGMPFSQIQEKHGDVVAIWYRNGGPIAKLQDGSGKYGFEKGFDALDGDIDRATRDEHYQYLMDPLPQPKPDAVIRSLQDMHASDIFLGLTETLNSEQVAEIYGVTLIGTSPAEQTMDGYNLCSFEFEDLTISLITDDDFCVTPDSIVYYIRKTDLPVTNIKVRYTINEDRLAEIGKTYAALEQKYEKAGGATSYDNIISYGFQNCQCSYVFNLTESETAEYSKALKDEHGDHHPSETMPTPPEDRVCIAIRNLPAYNLFSGMSENINAEQLAERANITLVEAESIVDLAGHPTKYAALFHYDKYEIMIRTDDQYQISGSSMIAYIKLIEE